ncbi:MAG: hypothetical protein GY895_18335 [Phycisphaera sp.]|nr:hypothetical protein [Phycisphaera sp.]
MRSVASRFARSIQRFVAEEDGVESVEWLTLAILMASIVLYFGRNLLAQLFDAFLAELIPVDAG